MNTLLMPAQATPSAQDGGRSFGLDLARAAAIILVFMSHTVVNLVGPFGVTALQWGGRAGVELFFALSGFLIGTILIKTARAGLNPASVAGFLFRRWMRTLPLYFMVLWFAGWFFGNQNLHAYLLLQNFYPKELRVLPASWSLVMEEYFYLFFPLTMLLFTTLIGQGARVVTATAALLIGLCLGGRLLNAAGIMDVPLDIAHENPFLRMDCAAYGVIAAALMQDGSRTRAWLTARRARILLAAALAFEAACCLFFVFLMHRTSEELLAIGFGSWGRLYLVLQWAPVTPVFAVAVVALWVLRPHPHTALAMPIRAISLWSYSIYLLHAVVIVLVDRYDLGTPGPVRLAVIVALSLGASALSYHLVERPVLWVRDRMVRGQGALGRGPVPVNP